jgi:NAD(P) transhydrogenase subunit alpha
MKPGSVIMDVSVDQGGNCEVTEPGRFSPTLGVNICGIQNIPGRMAAHASWLYANNMYYYVENLLKTGAGELDLEDEIVNSSLVTHGSTIHHQGALKAMRWCFVQLIRNERPAQMANLLLMAEACFYWHPLLSATC